MKTTTDSKTTTAAPATTSTKTDTQLPKPERKKVGAQEHVAFCSEALLRMVNRLRLAERDVYGDQKTGVSDLRKAVLALYVKADNVRSELESSKEGK